VFLEAAVIPMLMALADGVLVAWVLVELRNAGLGDTEGDSLDVVGVSILIPSAAVACLLVFPSRYVATGVTLLSDYIPPAWLTGTGLASYLRWQLGWGLVHFQAAAILFVGLLGAVAWSRGTAGDALKGYFRLLAAEGGHLVAALALAGIGYLLKNKDKVRETFNSMRNRVSNKYDQMRQQSSDHSYDSPSLEREYSEDYGERRTSHGEHQQSGGMLSGWYNSTFRGYQKQQPEAQQAAQPTTKQDSKRGVME